MLEAGFKTRLIQDLKHLFPGCIVLHADPTEIQGIPDLIVLYKKHWAALEGKKYEGAPCQPNQPYYVDLMDDMSFARFIYPENKQEVLNELEQSFKPRRVSRIPRC